MTSPDFPIHAHPQSRDSDTSQKIDQGGTQSRAEVHDHGSKTTSTVALILAAVALGAVLMVPYIMAARMDATANESRKAEREARVMQERWSDLKVELARRGIPVSDH